MNIMPTVAKALEHNTRRGFRLRFGGSAPKAGLREAVAIKKIRAKKRKNGSTTRESLNPNARPLSAAERNCQRQIALKSTPSIAINALKYLSRASRR